MFNLQPPRHISTLPDRYDSGAPAGRDDSRVLGRIKHTTNDTSMVRVTGMTRGGFAIRRIAGRRSCGRRNIKSECGHHRRVLPLVAFLCSISKERTHRRRRCHALAFVDLASREARGATEDDDIDGELALLVLVGEIAPKRIVGIQPANSFESERLGPMRFAIDNSG